MKKKFFNWPVMGVVLVTMLLMVNINAMAYKDSDLTKPAFSTDKSDRSLIKEILVNQKQGY